MIKRTRGSNPNMNQLLNEDSFTNKKGIDVTQAPPMRDFIVDANNLDVNLDGSLSLRKPLIATAITTEDYILTKELYTTTDYIQFTSSTITIKPNNNTVLAKYVKNGTEYTTSIAGLDFTKVEVTNTATSTIISNVLIDLTVFAGGDLDVANLSTHSVYGSFRLVKDAQTSEWILEYTIPYVANLLRTDSSSEFNPNTAGYYTYALRDTYNSPYYSVQGILAYTDAQGSTTVADLTETDKYKHFIVNSTKDSIPVILKAFCTFNKNNITNNIYYGCWECSVDGVTYTEVPEFIEQWENSPLMTTVKVVNNMLSKSTLDDPDDIVYDYKRVVSLANINSEEDLMSTRPDILKINSISGATYRFTIYYTLMDRSRNILSRHITKLSNKTVDYNTLDEIYRLDKTSDFTSEDFVVAYGVEPTFSANGMEGKVLFKNSYDATVATITLPSAAFVYDNVNYVLTVTGSSITSTIESLSGKNQLYNIKSVEIVLLNDDNSTFDTIKYTVLDVKGRLSTPDSKETARMYTIEYSSSPASENRYYVDWRARHSHSSVCLVNNEGTITEHSMTVTKVSLSPLDFTNFHYYACKQGIVCDNVYGNTTLHADTLTKAMNNKVIELFRLFIQDEQQTYMPRLIYIHNVGYSVDPTKYHNFAQWLNGIDLIKNASYNGRLDYTYLGDVPYDEDLPVNPTKYYIGANGKFLEKDTAWANEQALIDSINADSRYYNETHPDVDLYIGPATIYKQAYSLMFALYNHTYGDTLEVLNKDMVNANKGKKLYYKYRLYSYGENEFKNCIYVSDSNSFITSLLNTIDLPISQDSNITALIPWREYLIASNESNIFLITPTGDGFTSKVINTFIGIPKKDSETLKSILNGVIFKSGSKIYSLQPSVYSSNDNVLNIIDISKPVAPYIVDTQYDNFAFTTEQHYYLCIPNTSSTTVLKYEYATKIWTKHTYPDRFVSAFVNTVDDIRVIGKHNVYYFNHTKEDIPEVYADLHPKCFAQYGDLVLEDGLYYPSPFEFYVDTGQKSYSMNNIKQFVESKLIFAILDSNDSIPLTVDVYVDNYSQILHVDPATSSSFWRKMESMILGADIPAGASQYQPCIKQLFLRYSGKGYTIRHRISGLSYSNFKFYVSYYRYKSTINKH